MQSWTSEQRNCRPDGHLLPRFRRRSDNRNADISLRAHEFLTSRRKIEISSDVPPHGMNMICFILSVVVLNDER